MEETIVNISIMALPILLAITLHEAAHGYVANYFGDPTAKMMGRLSLNPIRHIDPFGTIILPLVLFFMGGLIFGYAKPVPVTTQNLKNPRTDMVWVALAGPAANIFLAFCGGILLLTLGIIPDVMAEWFAAMLGFMIFFNCIIAIFNILPVPPLDGSRVIARFMPGPMAYRFGQLDRYGLFIVIGVFFLLPYVLSIIGINLPIARFLIFEPANAMYTYIVELFT